jgi:hypothetical protein
MFYEDKTRTKHSSVTLGANFGIFGLARTPTNQKIVILFNKWSFGAGPIEDWRSRKEQPRTRLP